MGLKQDLQADLLQQEGDSTSFVLLTKGWTYLRFIGINDAVPEKDSVIKYRNTLTNSTDFIPNDSRFEALKSSGQLGAIENDSLQELILDLYQNRIRVLQASTNAFTHFKQEQVFPFLSSHMIIHKDGSSNFAEILRLPQMQNNLLMASATEEILNRYHAVMQQSRQIIQMINTQYSLH